MSLRSFLTLSVAIYLSAPTPLRAASDPPEATFWIRGIQQLYFAPDSGRRDFAATLGLTLPWELLWAQATAPTAAEQRATDATSTASPQQNSAAAVRAPRARAEPERAFPKSVLTPSLVQATLTRAYRAQGADEAESRLESLDSRSRWSAALPEVRVRAARATDESLRLTPTIDDPYRYTRDGGTDHAFEVRLTWRLSSLVFNVPEVSIERIRSERAHRRAELRREVLKLLFAWQRARLVAADVNALEEERRDAALTRLEAELTLNALTGGWFNGPRPAEVD